MGCDRYSIVTSYVDKDEETFADYTSVRLGKDDGDEEVGCLCHFLERTEGNVHKSDVEMLAYIGAAVLLGNDKIYSLPSDLPEWIRNGIKNPLEG